MMRDEIGRLYDFWGDQPMRRQFFLIGLALGFITFLLAFFHIHACPAQETPNCQAIGYVWFLTVPYGLIEELTITLGITALFPASISALVPSFLYVILVGYFFFMIGLILDQMLVHGRSAES